MKKRLIQAKEFPEGLECFVPYLEKHLKRTRAQRSRHPYMSPMSPNEAADKGPFEVLPQCLMYSEETLPRPPVFYFGFRVTKQWLMDLCVKENVKIWSVEKVGIPEDDEPELYRMMTLIPKFLQEKSGIKSFTLFLRETQLYGAHRNDTFIITIRTNYFYLNGLVPTDEDINKLRIILEKDEHEKPLWYMSGLYQEMQWSFTDERGSVYPEKQIYFR